jgi:hypothetical protein
MESREQIAEGIGWLARRKVQAAGGILLPHPGSPPHDPAHFPSHRLTQGAAPHAVAPLPEVNELELINSHPLVGAQVLRGGLVLPKLLLPLLLQAPRVQVQSQGRVGLGCTFKWPL